jgi:hypothetical protein
MARPGLRQHPKFKTLVQRLGEPAAHVLGHLQSMWDCCYETGDPCLGTPENVEAASEWDGEPGLFFRSVLECGPVGFVEAVPDREGVYQVHDLFDHAPEYVQKRYRRELERQKTGKTISQLRSNAAAKRWNKPDDRKQTDATVMQTADSCMQTDANGLPPAPAPAPTPRKKTTSSRRKLRFDKADKATSEWMFSLILANNPEHKPPDIETWANALRLMREQDGRTDERIREVFSWANSDGFWKANVLCPQTLRKQFDKLTAKMRGNESNDCGKRTVGPGTVYDPNATGGW